MLQALIAAVNETPEEDIRDALKSQTDHQLALVPRGPQIIKDTIAYNTTINTDDTVGKFNSFFVLHTLTTYFQICFCRISPTVNFSGACEKT